MAGYKKKSLHFIPVTHSFSEIAKWEKSSNKNKLLDVIDKKQKDFGEKVDFEILICQILYNLDNQEKIAFMFQLLRNDGYNIDNESAAVAMNIKIRKYMYVLNSVRQKIAILLKRFDLLNLINTRKLGRRKHNLLKKDKIIV